MKMRCPCGSLLSDNSDDLPHKGRLIADQDWNRFTESCERPVGYDWRLTRHIYQCSKCGRINFDDPHDRTACYWFKPESDNTPKTLLQSVGELK